MFNSANTSPQVFIQQVQVLLSQFRGGLLAAVYLRDLQAEVSLSDLTTAPPDGLGMPQADAQAILDACADAWGLAQIYDTGTDPRNPPAGYRYGDSIKRVLQARS